MEAEAQRGEAGKYWSYLNPDLSGSECAAAGGPQGNRWEEDSERSQEKTAGLLKSSPDPSWTLSTPSYSALVIRIKTEASASSGKSLPRAGMGHKDVTAKPWIESRGRPGARVCPAVHHSTLLCVGVLDYLRHSGIP